MGKDKVKIFKDSVHGYIEIPSVIVSNIIDTEQFQRLRYIEQTSMRSLYPAARHDRFIHSLGVYYLGKQAFANFMENSKQVIQSLRIKKNGNSVIIPEDIWWKKQQLLFEIACLMHDCAHAPFSHTFEQYYSLKKEQDGKSRLSHLLCEICEEFGDTEFEEDFYIKKDTKCLGAPHEQLSSYIILKEYKEAIKNIFSVLLPKDINLQDEDYVFICRMIIGCKYKEKDIVDALKNCIITLLNSSTIDVDGLDYIVRDAQMSGINTNNIDYQRILNAFSVLPVKMYNNEYKENIAITGLWLDGSLFKITSFKGRIYGKISSTGIFLNESLSSVNGNLEKKGNLACTRDFNAIVDVNNATDGEIQLQSSSKVEKAIFSGQISGKKILLPEDEIEGNLSFVLCYDKRCLSIIQNIIDARNNEYLWVYTHPKVLYNSNFLQCGLIDVAAEYFSIRLKDQGETEGFTREDFILNILGYEELFDDNDRIIKDKLNNHNYYFYRSNDNDVNSLFKRIFLEITHEKNESDVAKKFVSLYNDYYGRKQRKSIWKTYMEKEVLSDYCKAYGSDFNGIKRFLETAPSYLRSQNRRYIFIKDLEEAKVFSECGFDDVVFASTNAKTKVINFSEFFVKYGDRGERLCDIFDASMMDKEIDKSVDYIFYKGNKTEEYGMIVELNNKLKEFYLQKAIAGFTNQNS